MAPANFTVFRSSVLHQDLLVGVHEERQALARALRTAAQGLVHGEGVELPSPRRGIVGGREIHVSRASTTSTTETNRWALAPSSAPRSCSFRSRIEKATAGIPEAVNQTSAWV